MRRKSRNSTKLQRRQYRGLRYAYLIASIYLCVFTWCRLLGQTVRKPSANENAEVLKYLEDTANDPLVLADAYLGKQRIIVNRDLGTLTFRPEPAALDAVLSDSDPLGAPLEALIRLQVLRRDAAVAFPDDPSWTPLFNSVDQAVNACAKYVDIKDAVARPCPEVNARFEAVQKQVEAKAASLNLALVLAKGAAQGFAVKLNFEPQHARLRVMTELEYKKCVEFRLPLEPVWTDLLSDQASLIGKYHFHIDWPSTLGGPQDGDFLVTSASTVTFRP